jgi:hypothetical protein
VARVLFGVRSNFAPKREEMKKLAALTLSMFLVSGTAFADTPKNADPQPAKAQPAKPKAAKKADKSDAAISAQLEELRQTLQSQQEQLQMLKEELAKRDRQIDEAREAAAAANARATEASTKATEAVDSSAEMKSTAVALNSTVSDLKASNAVLKTTVAAEQAEAKKAEETGPSAIKYKGVTITPGGFIAAETVFRNRATSGDINTPFTGIPYPGNALAKVTESNFTARQTRATVLAETKIGSAKVTGYFESDFLGAGTTSNNRQSNSYVFRQRQMWASANFDNGFGISAGQMWSLATENKKGIQNRGEALPMQIDPQYVAGFTWQRAYGFRAVKSWNDKFFIAVAVEGPQATLGGRGFSLATTTTVGTAAVATTGNFFINAPGAGGGLYNAFDATGYTVNKAPDFLVKAAWDPGWGHYEVFGILSTFRNRVYPCGVVGTNSTDTAPPATTTTLNCAPDPTNPKPAPSSLGAFNDTRTGGGFGISANVPLFAKKLDFGIKGVAGDGIGRFGSAQLADLTVRPDGTQALIRTAHGLVRLEFHATPKLDIFAYYGGEYAARAAYQGYNSITITKTPLIPATATTPQIPATTTTAFKLNQIGGYGNRLANNSGCSAESASSNQFTPSGGGTCAGDIRFIQEGTLGFWHKVYQGPRGGVRWGLTYSYITKSGWSGAGGLAAGSAGISPKAVDNMLFTSFRYYLP